MRVMLKDKVFAGFIAGISAAFFADIANWIFHYMNLMDVRFMDWASIILLGHKVNNSFQIVVMQICQIIWDGFLGVVFLMLIPIIKSKGIILKGILYAFLLLFIFRVLTVLFALEPLKNISFETFLCHVLCSLIWGFFVSYILLNIYDVQTQTNEIK